MSAQAKHTPGPWTYSQSGEKAIAIISQGYAEQFRASVRICDGYPLKAQANARLIVAAPRMYQTLEKLRAWLVSPDLHASTIDEMREEIEAALEATRGGAQ